MVDRSKFENKLAAARRSSEMEEMNRRVEAMRKRDQLLNAMGIRTNDGLLKVFLTDATPSDHVQFDHVLGIAADVYEKFLVEDFHPDYSPSALLSSTVILMGVISEINTFRGADRTVSERVIDAVTSLCMTRVSNNADKYLRERLRRS